MRSSRFPMGFVPIVWVMIAFVLTSMVISPSWAQLDGEQARGSSNDTCVQGKIDGQRDARGNPAWILAGAGCGIFGAGAAYLIKPNPPMAALMGRSSEYVLCYTEDYRNKARNANTGYACAGWAVFVVVYLAAGGGSSS